MSERASRSMAAIGLVVAAGSGLAPKTFLSLFGVHGRDVTGAAMVGWRLFAVRTAFISGLAWRGNETARDAFLPVQVLDQVVFWHAFATRRMRRRGAVLASATSGAIIVLDLMRLRGARDPGTGSRVTTGAVGPRERLRRSDRRRAR